MLEYRARRDAGNQDIPRSEILTFLKAKLASD